MTKSSIRFWSAGGQVGWITKTSVPRTFSRIWQYASPSANRRHSVLPTGMPSTRQISCARAGWALPEKTLICSIPFALIPWRPPLRRLGRSVVGAGGFEPPVLDPKSSVLPLDDAPMVGSWSRPVLRRAGIVRVQGGGPPLASPGIGAIVPSARRTGRWGGPLRQDFLISGQHLVFDHLARLVVQGMGDVPERAVLPFLAGHRDEQAVVPVDNLDVADHEAVVNDDGNESLQFFFVDRKDPDLGDFHGRRLPSILRFFSRTPRVSGAPAG